MPRRGAVALVTTILSVVLLFSFKTADPTTAARGLPTARIIGAPPAGATPAPVAAGPRSTPRPVGGAIQVPERPGVASPTPAPTQQRAAGSSADGTFTGDPIDTFYGTVQVAVVEQAGKIVDVQELQMPSDRRLSAQISAQAGPMLRSQVLRVQSGDINGVSGASYTSYGFYESLQSALSRVQ